MATCFFEIINLITLFKTKAFENLGNGHPLCHNKEKCNVYFRVRESSSVADTVQL